MKNEIWKSVLNSDCYLVSNFGMVKSTERICNSKFGSKRKVPEKMLSLSNDKNGYKLVTLKSHKIKTAKVHRIVWEAFNDKIPNGKQINHIDGDKGNNRLTNLELVSPKENIAHALKFNLMKSGKFHHGTKKIKMIKEGKQIILFGANDIKNHGFHASSVHRAARGERKYYKGWECKYV